jgi:hypothetical protein
VDPAFFESLVPKMDSKFLDAVVADLNIKLEQSTRAGVVALEDLNAKIAQATRLSDNALATLNKSALAAASVSAQADLLDSLVPRIDPSVIAAAMQAWKAVNTDVFREISEWVESPPPESEALLAAAEELAPAIEEVYERQIATEATEFPDAGFAEDESGVPWDLRKFAGPTAVVLGVVIICALVGTGVSSPDQIDNSLSMLFGLIGYADDHSYSFHGMYLVALLVLALVAVRKSE